jgi:hypothetical protein
VSAARSRRHPSEVHGRHHKDAPSAPLAPLTEKFLSDLQAEWGQYGKNILEVMREQFPHIYFQCMVELAQVNGEFDQPNEFDRPRTREQVLQRLEEHSGPEGRKLFENFLARMGKLESADDEAS